MELWGRDLRYALVAALLSAGAPMSVPELVHHLGRLGFSVWGAAPNKVVADALGHELSRGRVVRVRRGWYRAGRVPRTTAWRMRHWRQAVLTRGFSRPPVLLLFDDLDRIDRGLPPTGAYGREFRRLEAAGFEPLRVKFGVLDGP